MADIKIKKLSKQAVAEMLATVCRGKGCPATYELGCPFKNGEGGNTPCGLVDTDFWLAAIEEAKPEFKFGDKVTVTDLTSFHGIFNAYTDGGRAYILRVGEYTCSAEFVSNIEAGWK